MTERSMWGDLQNIELVKTPISYLREQSDILSEQTAYKLYGTVRPLSTTGDDISYIFVIRAPQLKYEFSVVRISYKLNDFYPVGLLDYLNSRASECKDEEEFLSKLKSILSNPNLIKRIQSLLSQIDDYT